MSDCVVVIFTHNNARVLKNPRNIETFAQYPNAFINPDLKNVEGIPPHFWKPYRGHVLPMEEWERKERVKSIKKGVNNNLEPINTVNLAYVKPRVPWWFIHLALVVGSSIATLIFSLKVLK